MKKADTQRRPGNASKKLVVTRFGCVSIVAPAPSPREVRKQIAASKAVSRKLAQVLCRPGIKTPKEDRHIPQFRADPMSPHLVIRVLEGVTDRGKFVRGKFVKMA